MDEMPKYTKAYAMAENSAIVRFTAHAMLSLKPPPFPVKMFKNEIDAMNWLSIFTDKQNLNYI